MTIFKLPVQPDLDDPHYAQRNMLVVCQISITYNILIEGIYMQPLEHHLCCYVKGRWLLNATQIKESVLQMQKTVNNNDTMNDIVHA